MCEHGEYRLNRENAQSTPFPPLLDLPRRAGVELYTSGPVKSGADVNELVRVKVWRDTPGAEERLSKFGVERAPVRLEGC